MAEEAATRALQRKADGSSPDSPRSRKHGKQEPEEDVDKEFEKFDDKDVKGMMKMMLKEMRQGRGAPEAAIQTANEANQVAKDTQATVEVLRRDMEDMKNEIKDKVVTKEDFPAMVEGLTSDPWARAAQNLTGGAARRTGSVDDRSPFVPKEVTVRGFYDFDTRKGFLSSSDRDALAEKLTKGMKEDLRNKFTLDKTYDQCRRLVFKTEVGGEVC